MPVKVLDKDNYGSYSAIANGIRWAADNSAHIINMSLGGSTPSTTLENAVAYTYSGGVTIIAAAGNNGTNADADPPTPAALPLRA
ncbi:S8 family serine peptidase [Planctomycetaceae bacterium SH139]